MYAKYAAMILMGAIGMSTCALAQKISDDAVRIGVLTDMSGLYSDIGGQGSVTAAQMAIDDFGGKVLGKRSSWCRPIIRTRPTWPRRRRANGTTPAAST